MKNTHRTGFTALIVSSSCTKCMSATKASSVFCFPWVMKYTVLMSLSINWLLFQSTISACRQICVHACSCAYDSELWWQTITRQDSITSLESIVWGYSYITMCNLYENSRICNTLICTMLTTEACRLLRFPGSREGIGFGNMLISFLSMITMRTSHVWTVCSWLA